MRDAEYQQQVGRAEMPLAQLGHPMLVLFDAVGTLLEPVQPIAKVYAQAAWRWGSRRSLEEIAQRWSQAVTRYSPLGIVPRADGRCGLPWRAPVATNHALEQARWRRIVHFTVDDVLGSAAHGLFEDLWNYFADPDHWQVNLYLRDLWVTLQREGCQVGIASNYDQRLVGICRRLYPLHQAAYVFVSADIGFPKPHPNFYMYIERVTNLSGHQIAMIGDDWQCDVVGPSQRGWRTFLWASERQQLFPTPADAAMHGVQRAEHGQENQLLCRARGD